MMVSGGCRRSQAACRQLMYVWAGPCAVGSVYATTTQKHGRKTAQQVFCWGQRAAAAVERTDKMIHSSWRLGWRLGHRRASLSSNRPRLRSVGGSPPRSGLDRG